MTVAKKQHGSDFRKDAIRLLLIDDEAAHWAGMFDQGLRPYGFELSIEARPDRAVATIIDKKPHVILLDLHFPGDDLRDDGCTTGGELLGEIRKQFPDTPVVVFTTRLSDADIPLESFAIQPHGKFSKHQIAEKQVVGEEWEPILAQRLNEAIEVAEAELRPLEDEMGFVVGSTAAMRHVTALIRNAARHDFTVLIYGETGTGKRGVAEAIHRLSKRKGRFEHQNCSGVHEETLTDLLFGHAKGAYTGAVSQKPGLFELANGGSLFLDEIQAMLMALQNHLMTAVESNVIRRMGSDKDIEVDARLIVATNQPLAELVNDEILREDLAYRLNEFPISLPPLRERMQDLPELCRLLIDRANKKLKKQVTDVLRPEVMERLQAYDWPGNIRELDTVLKRAVATTTSNVLEPSDIEISPLTSKKMVLERRLDPAGEESAPVVTEIESIEDSLASQAVEIAVKIDDMPVAARYSFITGNFDGELRRLVFIEIVRLLRSRQGKKVRHKQLANYLDVIKDAKDFERIRQMVVSAGPGIRLTQLECNQ